MFNGSRLLRDHTNKLIYVKVIPFSAYLVKSMQYFPCIKIVLEAKYDKNMRVHIH